jgi:endo-1,4-beta-xylanase
MSIHPMLRAPLAFLALITLLMAGLGGATSARAEPPAAAVSLREAARPFFLVGVAVNPRQCADDNSTEARLIRTHFNVLTPDNAMKWAPLQPRPGQFDFHDADRLVDFARRHKLYVVGHTLVWHSQTPGWVFAGENGAPPTRELLLARMRDHIATVVGRYKGRVQAWDVVNEALNDDGTLRDSPWRRIIGEDYIEKAFEYAHDADPSAHLYYNDYRLEVPSKRAGALAIVKRLKAAGLRVDAVGIQGHVGLERPTVEEQEAAILAFHEAGIKSMITEMDVDVLPSTKAWGDADIRREEAKDPSYDPYAAGLPPKIQADLAARYAELFKMYLKHRDKVLRVTLWGLNDGGTWLNDFPIRGRTNHPLLFNRQNQPKPALQAILDVMQSHRAAPSVSP